MLRGAREKYRVWFHQTDLSEDDIEDKFSGYNSYSKEGNQMSDGSSDRSGEMEKQVNDNTAMTHENRKRIVRIDERTAFIARIIFALFIGFLVALAGGLTVALLPLGVLPF